MSGPLQGTIAFTPSNRVKAYAADYLLGYDAAHPPAADPAAIGRHPEDLPVGWQDDSTDGAKDGTGHHPARRMFNRGDQALRLLEEALAVAGFLPHEIGLVGATTTIGAAVEALLTDMWEFRRYGFKVDESLEWRRQRLKPHIARVYADAGLAPRKARELEEWSYGLRETGRGWVPGFRERVILVVLDHRVSRKRAVQLVEAGVSHDEVPEWQRRFRAGDDVAAALATLKALRQPFEARSR